MLMAYKTTMKDLLRVLIQKGNRDLRAAHRKVRRKKHQKSKNRYLLSKGLLTKKVKHLLKIRERHLKLLLLLWVSRSSQFSVSCVPPI